LTEPRRGHRLGRRHFRRRTDLCLRASARWRRRRGTYAIARGTHLVAIVVARGAAAVAAIAVTRPRVPMSISRRMPAVTEAMSPAVAVSPAKAMATKPVASEPMTTEVTRAKAVAAEAMTTKAMTTEVMTAKPVAAAEVAATMMTTTTVITTTAAARGSGDWRHRRQSSDGEREQEGRSKRSAQSATNAGHSVLQGLVA
jgi:hypothetical protein